MDKAIKRIGALPIEVAAPAYPSREKRSAQVKAHITPALREQLELFVRQSNVTSISDYLFEIIEDHVAMQSIRISKQKLGRRFGNQ